MTDTEISAEDMEALGVSRDPEEILRGSMPTMPDPEGDTLVLPRGLYVGGSWQKDVKVRELTGADEETLARQRDPLDYFDAVIAMGTEVVGAETMLRKPLSERQRMLSDLLVGERELLFLNVIRATFGNERDVEYSCPACQSEFTTTLLLDTDLVLENPLGEDTPSTYEFTTSKGRVIEYRLVVGSDQREAMQKKNATAAEQNTVILSRVVQRVDGEPVGDRRAFVLSLSIKDRRDLVAELDAKQPKVNNDIEIDCQTCGRTNVLTIDWGDLFRP